MKPAYLISGFVALLLAVTVLALLPVNPTSSEAIAAASDAKTPSRKLLHGRLMHYEGNEGYFEFKAQGDRGSHLTLRMDFTGFHVFPQLALTRMVQQGGADSVRRLGDKLRDVYIIIPENVKITTQIKARYEFETVFKGIINRVTRHHNENVTAPFSTVVPPENMGFSPEIHNWIGQVRQTQVKSTPFHQCVITVFDRSAAGGKTWVSIEAGAVFEGAYDELKEVGGVVSQPPVRSTRKARYTFEFTAMGERPTANALVNTRTWPMVRCHTSAIEVVAPVSWQDLILDVGDAVNVPHSGHPGGGTLKSDHSYQISYDLHLRPMKELKVYLDPDPRQGQTSEKSWMPTPGETRHYKLTLEDPGPKDIEAIRFTLVDASTHDGIATNAGNHIRGDTCSDCKAGKQPKPWRWEVFMGDGSGGDFAITRGYEHYNDCKLDALPDIFFCSQDNADYDFGEKAVSEGLNYTVSQEIERDDIKRNEYTVAVRVMDGAASARLSAAVKIAGIWYAAQARGDTAADNGTELMLPLDADGDGMHDQWEKDWEVDDPDADDDAEPKGDHTGDGLTNFEEYRGIYAKGKHRRLPPDYKTVCVYDYAGCFGPALDESADRYWKQRIRLIALAGDEFYQDTINCRDTAHKKGDQYIVVLMSLDQVPGYNMDTAAGRASHVGPPTRERNTVMIATTPMEAWFLHGLAQEDWSGTLLDNLADLVSHEIGHNINMPHHGDTEGYRTVNGVEAWVALLGGQHSGDTDCIMRYRNAKYFLRATSLPRTVLGDWLSPGRMLSFKPKCERDHFCTAAQGTSICRDASEGRGNCLSRIKIRSW